MNGLTCSIRLKSILSAWRTESLKVSLFPTGFKDRTARDMLKGMSYTSENVFMKIFITIMELVCIHGENLKRT